MVAVSELLVYEIFAVELNPLPEVVDTSNPLAAETVIVPAAGVRYAPDNEYDFSAEGISFT